MDPPDQFLLVLFVLQPLPAVAGGLLLLFEVEPQSSDGVTLSLPEIGAVGFVQPTANSDTTDSTARESFMGSSWGLLLSNAPVVERSPLPALASGGFGYTRAR